MLTEVDPWHQKTLPDFLVDGESGWGIAVVGHRHAGAGWQEAPLSQRQRRADSDSSLSTTGQLRDEMIARQIEFAVSVDGCVGTSSGRGIRIGIS